MHIAFEAIFMQLNSKIRKINYIRRNVLNNKKCDFVTDFI